MRARHLVSAPQHVAWHVRMWVWGVTVCVCACARACACAQYVADMDSAKFAKLCKDAGLIGRGFTVTDADLIFTKVRPGPRRGRAGPGLGGPGRGVAGWGCAACTRGMPNVVSRMCSCAWGWQAACRRRAWHGMRAAGR